VNGDGRVDQIAAQCPETRKDTILVRPSKTAVADHSAHLAVVRLKVSPNARQIDEPINLSQHMTARDVPLQAEAIELRFLHHPPLAHYRSNLPSPGEVNQHTAATSEFFNTIGGRQTFASDFCTE
jgi:hypothetical protein